MFFGLLMACWATISKYGHWEEALFPSPMQVFRTIQRGITDGSLPLSTAVSMKRMLIGYSISMVIGLPLGILLARIEWLEDTVGSLVLGLQTLPSICWLPLALLWFGLNDTAILFVVIMGALLAITVAVKDGVKNVPPGYLRAARTMGVSPLGIYTQVLIPASMPSILTGAKLGWSFAWRALMSGELLVVGLGLGQQLESGRDNADMSQVLAVMLVIVALGLFTDLAIFSAIENRVRERWGLTGARQS